MKQQIYIILSSEQLNKRDLTWIYFKIKKIKTSLSI